MDSFIDNSSPSAPDGFLSRLLVIPTSSFYGQLCGGIIYNEIESVQELKFMVSWIFVYVPPASFN
jgi:hypothetical protein